MTIESHHRSGNPSDLHSLNSRKTVDRIEQLLESRDQLAGSLDAIADSVVGGTSTRLRALGKWFQQPVSADDVLRHPDATLVCSMLLANCNSDMDLPKHIHDSARDTFEQVRQQEGLRRRLAPQLVYPFLLLFVCYSLCVVASFFLIEDFEGMYNEFSLDLPAPTAVMFGIARSIRRWWMIGFVLFALFAVSIFTIVLPRRTLPRWTRVLRIQSLGLRKAWVAWAWHTGWLLKAGIDQGDAVALAGSCSTEPWLRRNSAQWSEEIFAGRKPFAAQPRGNWQPHGLLAHAFQLNNVADQADVLHAYAAIYRERASQSGMWWLSWLTPVVAMVVGVLIVFFTIALFMPTLNLISGLT